MSCGKKEQDWKSEKTFSLYALLGHGTGSRNMSEKKLQWMDSRTRMTSGRKNNEHSQKKKQCEHNSVSERNEGTLWPWNSICWCAHIPVFESMPLSCGWNVRLGGLSSTLLYSKHQPYTTRETAYLVLFSFVASYITNRQKKILRLFENWYEKIIQIDLVLSIKTLKCLVSCCAYDLSPHAQDA